MTRLLSAAVLIALILATLWLAPAWATAGLAALAAALAGGELARLARSGGALVSAEFVGAASAIVCGAFAIHALLRTGGDDVFVLVLLAGILATGAISLAAGPPGQSTIAGAGIAFMGPLYVGLPLGTLAAIRLIDGPQPLLLLLLIVAVSDSAQYYSGRAFGRHKLAPAVSPAKTVEGAVGGLVAAAIVGAVAGPRLGPPDAFTLISGALVALFLAAFGMIGDLFESMLKRSVGAKDSSQLIPGHGGVLDRIDSYLFAAPCYYVVLRWLV
jgi:phosphatidate cytidylyltransferase